MAASVVNPNQLTLFQFDRHLSTVVNLNDGLWSYRFQMELGLTGAEHMMNLYALEESQLNVNTELPDRSTFMSRMAVDVYAYNPRFTFEQVKEDHNHQQWEAGALMERYCDRVDDQLFRCRRDEARLVLQCYSFRSRENRNFRKKIFRLVRLPKKRDINQSIIIVCYMNVQKVREYKPEWGYDPGEMTNYHNQKRPTRLPGLVSHCDRWAEPTRGPGPSGSGGGSTMRRGILKMESGNKMLRVSKNVNFALPALSPKRSKAIFKVKKPATPYASRKLRSEQPEPRRRFMKKKVLPSLEEKPAAKSKKVKKNGSLKAIADAEVKPDESSMAVAPVKKKKNARLIVEVEQKEKQSEEVSLPPMPSDLPLVKTKKRGAKRPKSETTTTSSTMPFGKRKPHKENKPSIATVPPKTKKVKKDKAMEVENEQKSPPVKRLRCKNY